jgi:hypothetical protein
MAREIAFGPITSVSRPWRQEVEREGYYRRVDDLVHPDIAKLVHKLLKRGGNHRVSVARKPEGLTIHVLSARAFEQSIAPRLYNTAAVTYTDWVAARSCIFGSGRVTGFERQGGGGYWASTGRVEGETFSRNLMRYAMTPWHRPGENPDEAFRFILGAVPNHYYIQAFHASEACLPNGSRLPLSLAFRVALAEALRASFDNGARVDTKPDGTLRVTVKRDLFESCIRPGLDETGIILHEDFTSRHAAIAEKMLFGVPKDLGTSPWYINSQFCGARMWRDFELPPTVNGQSLVSAINHYTMLHMAKSDPYGIRPGASIKPISKPSILAMGYETCLRIAIDHQNFRQHVLPKLTVEAIPSETDISKVNEIIFQLGTGVSSWRHFCSTSFPGKEYYAKTLVGLPYYLQSLAIEFLRVAASGNGLASSYTSPSIGDRLSISVSAESFEQNIAPGIVGPSDASKLRPGFSPGPIPYWRWRARMAKFKHDLLEPFRLNTLTPLNFFLGCKESGVIEGVCLKTGDCCDQTIRIDQGHRRGFQRTAPRLSQVTA